MTAIAIIQARMGSSRLPGKVLEQLNNQPVLSWVIRASKAIIGISRAVIATSTDKGDDVIAQWCTDNNITCYRGSELDVLGRFSEVARLEKADTIMRITADCPFLDPVICGQVLMLFRGSKVDYASNVDPVTWPDGLDCEVFSAKALFEADKEALDPFEREHVTPFIRNQRMRYKTENLICPFPGMKQERWTLDTPEDLKYLRSIARKLPDNQIPSHLEVLEVLKADPTLQNINATDSSAMSKRTPRLKLGRLYNRSEEMLENACAIIPLGSQTFSKSYQQYPRKAAPLFLTHGEGGRVWDVDGNEYVDMVCGLLSVILGYRDPDVDYAIRRQLDAGISFSLATDLERVLAGHLVDIIPCAEMVRFGKNGTDATSAAIRLARAKTGRDHIGVCGYHGWQDWYLAATTRNKGIPEATRGLTHNFPYNDLEALEQLFNKWPNEFAAIILEPMNIQEPQEGYLEGAKELAHKHGALLIFDEIITGFRYSLGGAQELFDVTPDLATFGKSMANGLPLSAIVGQAEIMAEMDHVFLSSTFGGEALSIAAAIRVIEKMKQEPIVDKLWSTGAKLANEVSKLIEIFDLSDVITISGKPPWKLLTFKNRGETEIDQIRTLFIQEMIRAGLLTLGSHNICSSHSEADVQHTLMAYEHALGILSKTFKADSFASRLSEGPIIPVFKIR